MDLVLLVGMISAVLVEIEDAQLAAVTVMKVVFAMVVVAETSMS